MKVWAEILNPVFRVISSKFQLFSLFLRLNPIDASYNPNFFYEHKELITADLPDTQNVCLGRIEKFLEGFEKQFYL